ncbi:MAG: hypothetical protein K8T20_18315 [Planctomycetes bacterium]|nr:hypothetical protein [Planctomycetota bacterium]
MKTALAFVAAALLAGCASAPPKERVEVRPLSPGQEVMPGLMCVSVSSGAAWRVVVRNTREENRALVWYPLWRSKDGYVLKNRDERVRELVVPANGNAEIVVQAPVPEATQFEVLIGDRP